MCSWKKKPYTLSQQQRTLFPEFGNGPSLVVPGARSEAGTSSAADAAALGKAPPCQNFHDLVPFDSLDEAHQKFYNCGNRNAIAEMHESLNAHKAAIKDLIVQNLDEAY